jgi:16S rRNA (adenine1518-N6/adenine1519-N6)-dimethyltransferase
MNDAEPKKSMGQHWLNDEYSLEAICEAAAVQPTDTVLEIGPGLGSLTKLLAGKAERVIAVEFDEKLAAALPMRIDADNLEVVSQDILSFDFSTLPAKYKVIANIPYYLTNNLIRSMSETPNSPQVAAILVQKEVAQRAAAKPGSMSLLSVTAQFYWEVSLGEEVAAELFTPPPKVDSQILIMRYRASPLFEDVDQKAFFRVVKAGFSQRRKTLINSLSSGLHLDKEIIGQICADNGIDSTRRAQTLSLQEWHVLYQAVNP